MIIKDFRVYHISKKLNPALPNAVYSLEYIEHVFLELDTDMYTGVGMAYTFNTVQAEAMKLLVEGYCRNLIGKDPSLIRAHWQAAQCPMGGCGQTGLPMAADAVGDTARGALVAQEAGTPRDKRLGAKTDRLPVYGSGGWLVPQEDMIQEALWFQSQGYTKYKLKLGFPDWRIDVERLTALRKAVGDDFEIMVDVNQGWSVKQALEVIPFLRELGITYLEEPLHCQDFKGNAQLAAATDIMICSGECLFTTKEIFELLRLGGADYINPDLMRCHRVYPDLRPRRSFPGPRHCPCADGGQRPRAGRLPHRRSAGAHPRLVERRFCSGPRGREGLAEAAGRPRTWHPVRPRLHPEVPIPRITIWKKVFLWKNESQLPISGPGKSCAGLGPIWAPTSALRSWQRQAMT